MAGLEGAQADEGYANTGGPKDGPVLMMMSKRLRALRKKFNRILQIEVNKAQGKTVNKEQEEVLKTKIAVAALIDEYEKLRQPLLIAVKEEVAEREKELLAASLERAEDEETASVGQDEKLVGEQAQQPNEGDAAVAKEGEGAAEVAVVGEEETGSGNATAEEDEVTRDVAEELPNGFVANDRGGAELQEAEESQAAADVVEEEGHEQEEETLSSSRGGGTMTDAQILDLLTLLYFSQLFDVRWPGETQVWTKVHERSSCVSYDFVTDDATSPLVEEDLDALAIFGSLLTTRPINVTLSHKEALEKCLDHAKAWLAASESTVGESLPDLTVSYSGLRERLNRILASEYFTMTPEITTVSQQSAAAAAAASGGQFLTKVLVHEGPVMGTIGSDVVVDDTVYHQDGAAPQFFQAREFIPAVPLVVANGIPVPSPLMAVANSVPFVPESLGAAMDIPQFGSHDDGNQESPDTDAIQEAEHESTQSVPVQQNQPQNQNYYGQAGPRSQGGYQNPRGRPGGYQGGGRGRGGGFPNGRGGRGGRGYANANRGDRGDRQFYDQGGQGGGGGGFHPRQNYYGGRSGRGPRGSGGGGGGGSGGGYNNSYNNGHSNSNGPAQSAPAAPSAPAVATGST